MKNAAAILILIGLGLLVAAHVDADDLKDKSEAQKHACVADFMKLCHPHGLASIIPKYDLMECIKEHRPEISQPCQKVLAEYGL